MFRTINRLIVDRFMKSNFTYIHLFTAKTSKSFTLLRKPFAFRVVNFFLRPSGKL